MATTTNYGWTTPDDTSLVKDGAAAIRTLGSSVDTTTKALNPSTTLGDIEYRSATANTNTRLGIGTTGQVLTVSGGVPAWTTPTGSTPNFTLLSTTTFAGATTTISSIPARRTLRVIVESAAVSDSFPSILVVRFNSDSGSNYDTSTVVLSRPNAYLAASLTSGSFLDTGYSIATKNNQTGGVYNAGFIIDAADTTGAKVFSSTGCGQASGSQEQQAMRLVEGMYLGGAAISSISFSNNNSANFSGGTVRIYGSVN
jgi:hypothetical protein